MALTAEEARSAATRSGWPRPTLGSTTWLPPAAMVTSQCAGSPSAGAPIPIVTAWLEAANSRMLPASVARP